MSKSQISSLGDTRDKNLKFQIREIYLSIFLLIALGIIPLFDLLHPGLPLTHDGQDHVARIANFYLSLTDGNIIPRWAANLNWGYGHPILMFLYPLPSYIASFFHLFGFSLTDSLKIVFGISFVISGIAMYIWVRNFLGEAPGVLAGILYMYAPYRFVDLYVRGAIGEHVAFIFPPLFLYFLLKISKKQNTWHIVGGSLSLAGLVLSHNAITIMFLPLIFLYMIYLYYSQGKRKEYFIWFGLMVFLGFGISSFFLIPAFYEGKYTLRDIVTKGEYALRFVTEDKFISSKWSYEGSGRLSVYIGLVQIISLILFPIVSFILIKRKDKKLFIFYSALLLATVFSLFLMLKESNFVYVFITTLQKFQFPWRFMSVVVFTTSVSASICVFIIKNKNVQIASCILLILFAFVSSMHYFKANGYLRKSDSFYKRVYYGTTDTGESAPIWSVRFMERPAAAHMEIIEGMGSVKELSYTSVKHVYDIEGATDLRVRENTLYFPGWNVYVDDRWVENEFQDPKHRGLMTFFVDKGNHKVVVAFGETKLRKVANSISAVSFVGLIGYGFYDIWSIKKKKNTKHKKT